MKMAKSEKKRSKDTSGARGGAMKKDQSEAASYVSSLLNLHKLQGALLKKLQKEIR